MKETQVKTHTLLQDGDMPRSQSGSSCLSQTQNPACWQKASEKGGGGRSIRLKILTSQYNAGGPISA